MTLNPIFVLGLSMAACNPTLARAVNHIVAEHYPERMGLVIVINHGIVFEGIWRGMRLFIHPRTASKLRLCRGDKVETTFQELFSDDLRVWLLKEMELNGQRTVSPAQLQFWRKPADSGAHDPRGCPSYVCQYIEKYYKEIILPQANENVEQSEVCTLHKPHSNIIQALKEEAMLQVQQNWDFQNANFVNLYCDDLDRTVGRWVKLWRSRTETPCVDDKESRLLL